MMNLLDSTIKKINSYYFVRDVERIELLLRCGKEDYTVMLIKEHNYFEGNYCGLDNIYNQMDTDMTKQLYKNVVAFIMEN